MRDRALVLPCPIFMFSHAVAAPAASEPTLVLRGAVDEFGIKDSVDREVAELLQARDERAQFRERTPVIARHAISVPVDGDVQHPGLLVMSSQLTRRSGVLGIRGIVNTSRDHGVGTACRSRC